MVKSIPTSSVKCCDDSTDIYVDMNPNPAGLGNVQAFVDCFKHAAEFASTECYGLPVNLILAQWGGESGWASGKIQKDNQNWSNIIYTSSSNPPGCIGKGVGKWAKFEGMKKHAEGYARFFIVNSRYSSLIDYLKDCQDKGINPDADKCARYIADAGYGGPDHDGYYNSLKRWMATLAKYCDI